MKTTLFIAGLILLSAGCQRVENYIDHPGYPTLREAEIVYYGPPEVDGCDWLIKVDDLLFHPEALDDRFKTENLKIRIDYLVTREIYRCGRGGVSYKTIRLVKIEELNKKGEVGILQTNQWDKLKMDS
ncbi:MAG TPA: hypothetical protein PLW67_06325, partial [Prolixibacteraceae bacterium]|nr:hypothetical protein [Prolixibacteraceae bacterium]